MTHNESTSETELIHRIQNSDQKAMKIVYDKYVAYLTAVCSRYVVNFEDVRDILQNSFIKIFSSINKYKQQENASLKSWMTRIVVNDSLKFLKKNEHLKFLESVETYPDIPSDEIETDCIPYVVMRQMISQLPSGYRTVFNLFVFEKRSHKEIADMLGIKENTSASQFYKAKKLLATKIKQYQNE